MDDLEATQSSFRSPQTQEELDAILEGMGASRPTRTFGATLSPTLRDELGNPIPVDVNGEPIIFEPNADYDPEAKPSFENFRKNMSEMAEGVAEGAKAFASDPAGALVDTANAAGQAMYESVQDFGERIQTGNTTLQDVFNTVTTMMGAGPTTGAATRGIKATVDDLTDPNTSRIFLTPGTPNLSDEITGALDDAITLTERGEDALTIKQKTGWEKFGGKEWVYEIDDSQAQTKETALKTKATLDTEYTVPGGKVTYKDRQRLILEAQRDKLDLKKDLDAGNLTKEEYNRLLEARQIRLETELSAPVPDKVVKSSKLLAPTLKGKGKLGEVFFHPELAKHVDLSGYTASIAQKKGKETDTTVTKGDHDRVNKHINVYKQTPESQRKGVMIHEVQHAVDTKSGSSGQGYNKTSAASTIIPEAQKRYQEAMAYLDSPRGNNPSILEDTVDMMDAVGFGMLISKERLLDMIDSALYLERQTDGTFSSDLDVGIFKTLMKDAGNEDPDLTFNYLEQNRPDILINLKKIADVRGSRDRELAGMDPLKAYQNELGEAKARAAQFRADLSQEERRNSLASDDIRYSTVTGGPGMPLNTRNLYTPDEYQP